MTYYGNNRPYDMYTERWYNVDQRRKALYTAEDLASVRSLLKDFGVPRDLLSPPEASKTYGQLHRWKWHLINMVLGD